MLSLAWVLLALELAVVSAYLSGPLLVTPLVTVLATVLGLHLAGLLRLEVMAQASAAQMACRSVHQ